MEKESTVLVTGASGFIGFHVSKRLKAAGFRVIGLDNFSPYYSVTLKRCRQKQLHHEGIVVHDRNVEDGEFVKNLVQTEKVSHIVHLAAQAGVRYSLTEPKAYLSANIDGFLGVLEAARAFPHIRTVWASSSSVYGNNTKVPFSEEDRTDSPANLYGATKKSNELMAYAYHTLFGIELVGLRFFTVYGPWGRPDMAYFLFADKMMRQTPIEVFGNGTVRRDFTYVDDIVDGIVSAVRSPRPYGIYNLGNSQPERVLELVTCLERSLGVKALIKLVERPPEDMPETWADISKARHELGFSPSIDLATGIDRFAAWYLRYLEGGYAV